MFHEEWLFRRFVVSVLGLHYFFCVFLRKLGGKGHMKDGGSADIVLVGARILLPASHFFRMPGLNPLDQLNTFDQSPAEVWPLNPKTLTLHYKYEYKIGND